MVENRPNNLRVAIYARVSTEEQKEGQTIDSQVAELERYARKRSGKPLKYIRMRVGAEACSPGPAWTGSATTQGRGFLTPF